MATMGAFWEKASIYLNLPKITMTDVVEILIITFLFYYMLVWIKNTRAWVLLKGIMVILLFVLVAAVFQMNTIIWIAKNTLSVAITAIVIIFQPRQTSVGLPLRSGTTIFTRRHPKLRIST